MESILTSIKKLLGIVPECKDFDIDIIMHINSVFTILTQIGVGPSEGFSISDENAEWSDFISDAKNIEAVKSYTHLKVRLIFDPPTSSAILESMKTLIGELEWRINVAAEAEESEV